MPKNNIPVYAIVELLILLAEQDQSIGNYKGHTMRLNNVLVKTSTGNLTIPQSLIMKQFAEPEKVSSKDLEDLHDHFRPFRPRQKSA